MSDRQKNQKELDEVMNNLEWIKLRSEVNANITQGETFWPTFKRKTKENPFIPIGLLTTIGFLGYGLFSMWKGQAQHSQFAMRGRVVAQGLTVVALVGGVAVSASRKAPPQKTSEVF